MLRDQLQEQPRPLAAFRGPWPDPELPASTQGTSPSDLLRTIGIQLIEKRGEA